MTVESEVCKEVVGIGGKCGDELSSSQDPLRAGCNGKGDQGGDADNSYVFVTGSDGLSDDSGDGKEEDVVKVAGAGGNGGGVGVEDSKLDVVSGGVREAVEEENVGNIKGNAVGLVGNGVDIGSEEEASAEGGEKAAVDNVDVPEEQYERDESVVVPEVKVVEDSNERVDSVAVENVEEDQSEKLENVSECEIKQAEESNGGSVLTEVDEVTDKNGSSEDVQVNEVKLVEDPEILEIPRSAEMKEVDQINESSQDESKSEIKQVEDPNEALESVEGSEAEVIADATLNVAEDEIEQVEAPEKNLESSEGSESEVVADSKVHVAEDNIKQVEDPLERLEKSVGAEVETIGNQTSIIECATESDAKQVEDVNLMPENSAETEIEMVQEQKTEAVAESESPKPVNQITSEESSAVIEEPESQVGNDGLVALPEENSEVNDSSIVINSSSHASGASNDQLDLASIRISEISEGSQGMAKDPVEPELPEVVCVEEKEITLAKELVETVLSEVPPATSMDTDIDSHLVNDKVGTLEELANEASVSDVTANREPGVIPSIQGEILQVEETKSMVAGDDRPAETLSQVLEKTYEEDIPVSDGESIVQNDKDPEKQSDPCRILSEMTKSEIETESSLPSQSLPASSPHEPQGEIGIPSAETAEETSVAPIDGTNLQVVETGPTNHESLLIDSKNDDASTESASVLVSVVSAETEPIPLNDSFNVEAEESIVEPEILSNETDAADVKLESEVLGSGVASNVGKVNDVTAGLDVKNCDSGSALETDGVEDVADQLDSTSSSNNENSLLPEIKGVETSEGDSILVASPEGSRADAISGEEMAPPVVTRPFNYVMKVPRFNDDGLKEQIRQAKLQVEEKTKLRDAIQRQIQQIRANGQVQGVDFEFAKNENRNARKLVRLKRMEIDSLQSVISKAKNAISIGDIDARLQNVEHMIQHETMELKDEKLLLREIKQLKGLRGELSANMGTEEEIKQALEQREEAEERLKSLRKELELLKGQVLKTDSATREAGTKYDTEITKVRELQVQFKAANDVRQDAYARWLALRKELSEKNKHFFKYRDDAATASNYAFNRDTESLYRLCTDQVEKFMELWNTNEKFRKDYVTYNTRSTVRRFGTSDGRALGPDEEPIVLPRYVDERVHRVVSTPAKVDMVSQVPLEPKLEATVEKETLADLPPKKAKEQKNLPVKGKKAAEPVIANGLAPAAISLDAPDEIQDVPAKSREEIELDRKAEELRKKEAEAKLKEERRLEELAKANEARERKKRQAEKIQLRAELKARKEAEEREKEREKRLKKKERKKAGPTESNDGSNNSNSAPIAEVAVEAVREIDVKDMASVGSKKPQKYVKQSKAKSSIPPPLRNRNRKKWQQYAYVTAAGLLVLVLFWIGNIGLFSNKTLKRPNQFY